CCLCCPVSAKTVIYALSLHDALPIFALGTVLVVQALPRAVLMVVGGALADRLSSRLTMLGSMGLRATFVAPLAVLVLTGRVQMRSEEHTSELQSRVDLV